MGVRECRMLRDYPIPSNSPTSMLATYGVDVEVAAGGDVALGGGAVGEAAAVGVALGGVIVPVGVTVGVALGGRVGSGVKVGAGG